MKLFWLLDKNDDSSNQIVRMIGDELILIGWFSLKILLFSRLCVCSLNKHNFSWWILWNHYWGKEMDSAAATSTKAFT